MKDAVDIFVYGAAICLGVVCVRALVTRASQPAPPEAIVMEAEPSPAVDRVKFDLAEIEQSEPAKLPPQKPEKSVLSARPSRESDERLSAPATPIDPIQPETPPLDEPKIQPVSVSAPTSAPVYEWHNTIEEAVAAAKLRNVPVLIHFVAPPCQNCKLVRGMIDREPRVQRELAKYSLVSIDGEALPAIADEFGIREWNTIILYLPWKQGNNAKAFIPLSERVHFLSDLAFTRAQLEKP